MTPYEEAMEDLARKLAGLNQIDAVPTTPPPTGGDDDPKPRGKR